MGDSRLIRCIAYVFVGLIIIFFGSALMAGIGGLWHLMFGWP